MALPLAIPSPSGGNSPSSTDSSNGPQTPLTPDNAVQTLALPPPVDGSPATSNTNAAANATAAKRKPSRRANTAERRATHNAVERQRRETLNSRFLDLAALLPNLSQIRRPSKSSIVNSSIAHIHASRRHRLLAARELRLLKLESDAIRRELNEWRDRSGLPRVEEPVRGDAFQMILSGEVEVLNAGPIEEEDGGDEYGADDYGDGDYGGVSAPVSIDDASAEDTHMRAPMVHPAAASLLKTGEANPFAHTVSAPGGQGLSLQTMLPRSRGHVQTPMVVQSPTSVSFENPAMVALYEPHSQLTGPQYNSQYLGANHGDDKAAAWGAQLYGMPNGQGAQLPMFTPPTSSNGAPQGPQQAAFMMNLQRHQVLLQQQQRGHAHTYGSPDGDDSSSVGSAPGMRRERSGSMGSTGSSYGSPGSAAGYDMGAVPRRMPGSVPWDEGMSMGMQMMKGTPIPVGGGGGNGHGYAAMMM